MKPPAVEVSDEVRAILRAAKPQAAHRNGGSAADAEPFSPPPPDTEDPGPSSPRETAKPKASLKATDALAIFQREFSDPVAVIPELLFRGVTLFAGRPKVGKSWLTLLIALAVALDRQLFGRFRIERPGRVVYVALEEPASRTHSRLRKLQREADVGLQNMQVIYRLEPLMAGGAAQLDEYLAANPASLVVIDTLLAIVQANGKRDVLRSDYAEINILRELAEKHDCALLLVHHLRKMGGDGIDCVAGTTGLTAACDAVWTLKRQSGGEAILEITGREMEEKVLALRFDDAEPFGWKLIGEGEEVKLTEERREIFELLRDEAPLKPLKVAQHLRKSAVAIRRLLQKMLADGVLERNRDGSYVLRSTGNSGNDSRKGFSHE